MDITRWNIIRQLSSLKRSRAYILIIACNLASVLKRQVAYSKELHDYNEGIGNKQLYGTLSQWDVNVRLYLARAGIYNRT